MSNETKRDVFNEVLDEWQVDETMPDANWKYPDFKLVRIKEERFKDRYDAALPDDLPVVSKCVSEEIRDVYGKNSLLDELAWANQDALPSSEVSKWINNNESIFAEAWSRGLWIVEETGKVTSYDK
ncbi:hypothetical protein [Lacticaseibacillus paracasei]|jgi:hypothetical protein|uniref:hypothetical protein n=1 Tax=Lacticaseibacillus paracasei TaxID=1597 RepID=UPI0039935374